MTRYTARLFGLRWWMIGYPVDIPEHKGDVADFLKLSRHFLVELAIFLIWRS